MNAAAGSTFRATTGAEQSSELAGGTGSGPRLDGIDALRSLAILLVLLNHVNMRLLIGRVPYTHGLPAQLVASLVWNGQHGVQIFFAVSGFLITGNALRRWGSLAKVSIVEFYRRRFARIAPLLLALLAVLCVLHALQLRDYRVSAKTGGLGPALFAALTFHINVLEARRGYLPGSWDILWSLSVEEIFYLAFPLACRLLRPRWFVLLLVALVLVGPLARTLLAHGNEIWREYSYLGGMDAIALGCLTAIALPRLRLSGSVLRSLGTGGAILLILCLGASLHVEALGLVRAGLDMSIVAAATCLLMAAAAQSRWRSPRLLRPVLTLGQRSYEIYLTHMFVVFAFYRLFVSAGKPLWVVPILFGIVIIVCGLLGDSVARLYSEPANRWLRRHGPRQVPRLEPAAQPGGAL